MRHSGKSNYQGVMLALLVVAGVVSSAPQKKWKFDGSAQLQGGYESNLFRRPAVMDSGTGKYNPVEADGMIAGASECKAAYSASEKHRLQFSLGGDYTLFPKHLAADQAQLEARLEYRIRPIEQLNLKLAGDGGYHRLLAIDETSDGAADLYKYWQYDAGVDGGYVLMKMVALEARYLFTYKDFEEDSGQSLDNRQHEISAAIVPRFGHDQNQSITIEGSIVLKKYRELGSFDANALMVPTYPVRQYTYKTAMLEYKNDFGPVIWKIAERPRQRVDEFRDFYTYFENRLSTGLVISPTKSTKLAIEAAWRYRHYKVHEAARPGTNPKLLMQYVDGHVDFNQKIRRHLYLFAEYDLAERTTNTGYLSFHTYRDYTNHIVSGGVRVEW
jgi:hypothetical protein